MSKKTTQTQDTTSHQVQTPTNPSWVTDPLQNIAGSIGALSNLDPQSLIAGPDPLQTQAAGTAAGLTTPQAYQDAISALKGVGTAGQSTVAPASLLEGLDSYMSPYLKSVVGATSNDFDANAAKVRAQQALSLAGSGAFGGSGAALTQSATEGELARARASTLGALRNQGFADGAQLSGEDASRRQAASMANAQERDADLARQMAAAEGGANIATTSDADTRANIGTQAGLGAVLQALAQAKAGAPISLLGTQTGLFNSLPLGLVHGQSVDGTSKGTTTTSTSDPLGSLGSLALTGAALFGAPFTGGGSLGLLGSLGAGLNLGGAGALASGAGALVSDERLKRDIVKLGELANGLGVYLYRYLWSPIQFIGVMAQEVLKVKPEAVVALPNGFLAVRYGML